MTPPPRRLALRFCCGSVFGAHEKKIMKKKSIAVRQSSGRSSVLRPPSSFFSWVQLLRVVHRLRFPFFLLSSGLVAWLAHPGWLSVWWAVLFFVFGLLPRPWQPRRAPARSPWCPAGQRWLREQRAAASARPGRVYRLWSEAEWRARSAGLPWSRRPRYFVRGPV